MKEKRVLVGMGTCGLAAGAKPVMEALTEGLKDYNEISLVPCGCIGMCEQEVVIEVKEGDHRVLYGNMTTDRVPALIEAMVKDQEIPSWIIERPSDLGSFPKQRRIVLANCGRIDPRSIEEYIAEGGYEALKKALDYYTPREVLLEVKRSGLRGRGGGGFPTGRKWELTAQTEAPNRYIICNADEGDPGAFMDRSLMEGDPHKILEGMILAAYAIGSTKGYIYIRAEYPLAISRLEQALLAARQKGVLGDNILGKNFSFDIQLKIGAGAFVCGEETALIQSIEGYRGMPKPRPPYPAVEGLWGLPTNINNVETYACIAPILRMGGKEYSTIGAPRSAGTKVFALTGNVRNTGLVEVPTGITLREIIFDVGGGMKHNRAFKAVQVGGPSGGCIPGELLHLPIDYESLREAYAIMGSGGLVVMDEDTCMVDVARFFLEFTQKESCGKCTPCREGTKRMLEILTRITQGQGTLSDLTKLHTLAEGVKDTSLCGLGQTAPNPIQSTLRFFQNEYLAHIEHKKCPAKQCLALVTLVITESCIGCGKCQRLCPVSAIQGEKKKGHTINQATCIRCSACVSACPVSAIIKE